METTLVLLKPDAVQRGLTAEIIGRFERRGLHFRGMRLLQLDRATAEQHYAEHRERPFFGELVEFITSGPIVALALAGRAGDRARARDDGRHRPEEVGARHDPRRPRDRARPRTSIHGSDSPASAERELQLFFADGLLP